MHLSDRDRSIKHRRAVTLALSRGGRASGPGEGVALLSGSTLDTLRKKNALLGSLNNYALALAAVPASEDIFPLIAGKLKEITGAVGVALSTYDDATSELIPRYTTLTDVENSVLERALGCRIDEVHYKVPHEVYERLLNGVGETTASLSAFLSGVIPLSVAKLIEKILGVGWIITLGLQHKGLLIGDVVMAGRKGRSPFDPEALSAFTGVTANALGRWLAERSLAESEARWQFALEGAGDGVWDWNPQTDTVFFSRRWKTMLGYEESEVEDVPTEWYNRLHPDDAERCRKTLAQHLRGKTPIYQNEHRLRCKDGSYKWILARGKVVQRAEDGKPLRFIGIHTDVTERRRIEDALQESNALLQGLFDNMPSGAAIYQVQNDGSKGSDYIVKTFNPASLRLEGKARDEVIGKSLADLRPTIDDYGLISIFQKVWSTGESAYYPAKVYADGKFVNWYENYVFRLPTGEVISIYNDVTEQKKAEEALRKSELKFRSITEQVADAIFMTDTEGNLTYISPAAERLFGYAVDEMMGKPFVHFLSEEDFSRALPAFEFVIRSGQKQDSIILHMKRKDGSLFISELGANVFSEGDLVRGTIGIIRDITERKRAEAALQESEGMLRAFVTSSDDMIFLKDEHFRHLIANPQLCTFFGLKEESVLGKTDFEVMAKTEAQTCSVSDLQALESMATVVHEEPVGDRVFETVKFPVPLGPERWGVGGLIRDITSRKRAEEALQQSNLRLQETLSELRKMQEQLIQQERLAAVGQLSAGIAHDFNNTLATITLYTQLMLRTAELSLQSRERLSVIVEQAGQAANLVQQILDFSRRSMIERKPLSLIPFLKDVVELLHRTLPETITINLTCETDRDTIHADPTRIQQVLVNLALNARDAMSDGGTICITVSRGTGAEGFTCTTCGPVTGGQWVQVSVTDTGRGIPSDVLPHIFEPFFTTRAPLGHGLGLAQVYGIMKQHGGHIEVETQLGRGTTFKLYWPAVADEQGCTSKVASEIVQGNAQTILVVEDNSATRAALIDVLEGLNYRVLEAADGQQALALLDVHQAAIDLVLSDWVMPNMGGLKLVQEIQARNLTTRVVMLSGYPLNEMAQNPALEGVSSWIPKPFDLEQLAEVVSHVLSEGG